MPVTTRSKAERDTNEDNNPLQGETEIEQDATQPTFDDEEEYHPVFCLTEVPNEYFDEIEEYANESSPCIEITSNDPNNALAEIKANLGRSRPTPFLGCTVDQVYEFYKKHLRPAEDYSGPGMHFASFTFLVVDEECVRSKPWQCILCCDAPDFGERETTLKQLRLPIEEAVDHLCALEQLTFTVSSIGHPSGSTLSVMPPPTMMPLLDRPGLYRPATAAEARENKTRAIEGFNTADEALGE